MTFVESMYMMKDGRNEMTHFTLKVVSMFKLLYDVQMQIYKMLGFVSEKTVTL